GFDHPCSRHRGVRMTLGSPLDNPVWASLTGPHAHFAERHGRIQRYPEDVAPFLAIPDDADEQVWQDIAALAGPGAIVPVTTSAVAAPAEWEIVDRLAGVQLVDAGVVPAEDTEAIRLGPADVPD